MTGGAREIVRFIAFVFEWAGVAVITGGLGVAVSRALVRLAKRGMHDAYFTIRTTFGRSILLGLELLLAADLIRTMAIELTLENLTVLAVLIAIRTFLSWALEVEIDGHWPWKRPAEPVQL